MVGMVTPREGRGRLRAAAQSGELRTVCQQRHVNLLTVFGNAARAEPNPQDPGIAVQSAYLEAATHERGVAG
ncbi:MAG: hypothetical protein LC644_03235 [Pseudonocardia sp.]|nr:hypothetical protein [Pseudonocardia sp.]